MSSANWHIFVSFYFTRGKQQGYHNEVLVHHDHKITKDTLVKMRDYIMNQGKYDNVKILWFSRLDVEE